MQKQEKNILKLKTKLLDRGMARSPIEIRRERSATGKM